MRARTPPAPVPARKGTTARAPTPIGVRGLRPRTFRAKAPYLKIVAKAQLSPRLLGDDFELRLCDDDLRRIGPGHLLCAGRQRVVESSNAVVPGARAERQDGRGSQREHPEGVRVAWVRLRREGIPRLAPLHLVDGGAKCGCPGHERCTVERAAVRSRGQPSTRGQTRGEELAG